jgi:antitoxin (DNA-binding transcriptional repressor) of toxin-antitoxin stability system
MVSLSGMQEVTIKQLHEDTGGFVDRARCGERFVVTRQGKAAGHLVPPTADDEPAWDEILSDVRRLREEGGSQPNPVIEARQRRNFAARLR